MKKTFLTLSVWSLLLAGCASNELSREEALQMIQQKEQYPKVVDIDIYCSDPEFAKKVLDAGLEKQGIVTIQRTQKLMDVGKPLIHFTSKAQPYLLSTPQNDRGINVQKVKVADADIVEVTGIQTDDNGKSAVVEYTTRYKNVTPFSALTTMNLNGQSVQKAHFSLYDDGWRLER